MKPYTKRSFKTLTGDDTETQAIYRFESKDGMIEANFFFKPGNVETRGLIHKSGAHDGILHIVHPFAYPVGYMRKPPAPDKILHAIVRRLKYMEVYK